MDFPPSPETLLRGASSLGILRELLESELERARRIPPGTPLRDLAGADLTEAKLGDADLTGAILLGAILAGADLSAVCGLTQGQLEGVTGDARTRLPPGLVLPAAAR